MSFWIAGYATCLLSIFALLILGVLVSWIFNFFKQRFFYKNYLELFEEIRKQDLSRMNFLKRREDRLTREEHIKRLKQMVEEEKRKKMKEKINTGYLQHLLINYAVYYMENQIKMHKTAIETTEGIAQETNRVMLQKLTDEVELVRQAIDFGFEIRWVNAEE
ncbi:hypothetical protein [Treponema phagedenis]|uniref:Uncharacterized protein n=1 Tax=Treponema phagedenis TaxID=162 RepID=A0A0B7GZ24_TREPH|nr:hypothetical protein [Treponema phagedenis]NVP24979.1 hypothetical protein [Treponema phagedenis]QEJ96640.1 hypothetical protein FUT82_00525 [Treponema phagedenis]QEJ96687.1 hypothetical protein FUT82_00790 [Treponema phagedenis]QEJ98475.1 hypothetical protein FUT82_11030 [Treponema phagedenis]QEK04677.1 hypothetical protein FUT83_13285 [Treponema phagedenis]